MTDFVSLAPKSLQMVTAAMKLKDACSLEEKLDSTNDKSRQHIKKQRHHIANKGLYSQSYGHHVQMVNAVHIRPSRRLSTGELMLLNCGVGEDS